MTDVNAAIAEALAKANVAAPAQAVAPAAAPAASVPAVAPGRPRSLRDAVDNAASAAESWLSLKYYGFFIDKANAEELIKEFKATIKLADIKSVYMIRYMVGGQAKYARSFDGVVNAENNEPWQVTIENARKVDPTLKRQYDAFDLVFKLTEDAHKKSPVKAGARVGYTTSVTVYQDVLPFVRAMLNAEVADEDEIPVKVTHLPKKKGSNEWGSLQIERITN